MANPNPQYTNIAGLFQSAMQDLANAYTKINRADKFYVKDALSYGAAGIGGVNLTASGSGYTAAPTVTFSGGGASTQATGTAVLTGAGVSSVAMNSPGAGYTAAPTVAFSGGGGSGAAGTPVFVDFQGSTLSFVDPTQMGTIITELVAFNTWVDEGNLDKAFNLLPGAS